MGVLGRCGGVWCSAAPVVCPIKVDREPRQAISVLPGEVGSSPRCSIQGEADGTPFYFFFYFGRTETGEWGLCVATRAELEPVIP